MPEGAVDPFDETSEGSAHHCRSVLKELQHEPLQLIPLIGAGEVQRIQDVYDRAHSRIMTHDAMS